MRHICRPIYARGTSARVIVAYSRTHLTTIIMHSAGQDVTTTPINNVQEVTKVV